MRIYWSDLNAEQVQLSIGNTIFNFFPIFQFSFYFLSFSASFSLSSVCLRVKSLLARGAIGRSALRVHIPISVPVSFLLSTSGIISSFFPVDVFGLPNTEPGRAADLISVHELETSLGRVSGLRRRHPEEESPRSLSGESRLLKSGIRPLNWSRTGLEKVADS